MKRYRLTVDTAQVMSASRWWWRMPPVVHSVWAATWARHHFELEQAKVGPMQSLRQLPQQ